MCGMNLTTFMLAVSRHRSFACDKRQGTSPVSHAVSAKRVQTLPMLEREAKRALLIDYD